MRMVQGLFEGGVNFVQLETDDQCGNNSRVGRIQRNTVIQEIYYSLQQQKVKRVKRRTTITELVVVWSLVVLVQV